MPYGESRSGTSGGVAIPGYKYQQQSPAVFSLP